MLKVGDRVKVRDDLDTGKKYGGYFVPSGMIINKGKYVTIKKVLFNSYEIEEDDNTFPYYYTDEIFDLNTVNIKPNPTHVKCIDKGTWSNITVEKVYPLFDIIDGHYIITNNKGTKFTYPANLFELVYDVIEKPPSKTTVDVVNHPSHYTKGKIEVIDFIEDQQLGFHLGNALKYICRAGYKDKSKEKQDLENAIWYIRRKIKLME